jgi:hypothetical protein
MIGSHGVGKGGWLEGEWRALENDLLKWGDDKGEESRGDQNDDDDKPDNRESIAAVTAPEL